MPGKFRCGRAIWKNVEAREEYFPEQDSDKWSKFLVPFHDRGDQLVILNPALTIIILVTSVILDREYVLDIVEHVWPEQHIWSLLGEYISQGTSWRCVYVKTR